MIIDVHSLPGGVNGLDIGGADGHFGWFNNQTALDYSLQAIDAVISYVQDSGHPEPYTIAPINEPADNEDFSAFSTPAALTDYGAAWVLEYIQAVVSNVAAVNPQIPVMFQGASAARNIRAHSSPATPTSCLTCISITPPAGTPPVKIPLRTSARTRKIQLVTANSPCLSESGLSRQ